MSETPSTLREPAPGPTAPHRRRRSLLAELWAGEAGLVVTLVLTVALIAIAFALFIILTLLFAAIAGSLYVRDEHAAPAMFLVGLPSLILLAMLWLRAFCSHRVWSIALLTIALWLGFGLAIVAVVSVLPLRVGEPLGFALLFAGAGTTLIVWVVMFRRHPRGRRLRDTSGAVDLRCPDCQYRLNGLNEARCPECGSTWTLDELIQKQRFAANDMN